MARCFITGVELPLQEAYVLDVGAARRALQDLRQRVSVLDRLTSQLGERDAVEVFDRGSGAMRTRSDRRLVSATVAQALAAAHPERDLFLSWPEYRERGRKIAAQMRRTQTPAPANGDPVGERNVADPGPDDGDDPAP